MNLTSRNENRRRISECAEWLKEFLSDGELHSVESVREAYKSKGFSASEIKQARKIIGVKTFHQFDEYGATPNWFWFTKE